jgi:hypothetical protein
MHWTVILFPGETIDGAIRDCEVERIRIQRILDRREAFVEMVDWNAMTEIDRHCALDHIPDRLKRDLWAINCDLAELHRMSCSSGYTTPDEHQLPDPGYSIDDALEDAMVNHPDDLPEDAELKQFHIDAERVAGETIRYIAGGSYEMYARHYSFAIEPYLAKVDPALRPDAIRIANFHGYFDEDDGAMDGFGAGYCSMSGIEEWCCPCGRHE